MKNGQTVSIGIPVYNEGANIKKLLESILAQFESGFTIKEILVMSDGSSDNTKTQVLSLKDPRIKFIEDGRRLGKSARLDQIFRKFTGDILVLMDADILIPDRDLITRTIRDGGVHKAGIVGVNAMPLPAKTFFEAALESGVLIMKHVAKAWNNGNNYLAFKGCYLALDGALARKLHMPASVINNDAYLYFAAVEAGYTPVYLELCTVYYQSPMKLNDHIKQSSRFKTSHTELQQYFVQDLVKAYTIPGDLMKQGVIKTFISRPLTTAAYIGVNLYSRIKKHTNITSRWSIAGSTKGKMSL